MTSVGSTPGNVIGHDSPSAVLIPWGTMFPWCTDGIVRYFESSLGTSFVTEMNTALDGLMSNNSLDMSLGGKVQKYVEFLVTIGMPFFRPLHALNRMTALSTSLSGRNPGSVGDVADGSHEVDGILGFGADIKFMNTAYSTTPIDNQYLDTVSGVVPGMTDRIGKSLYGAFADSSIVDKDPFSTVLTQMDSGCDISKIVAMFAHMMANAIDASSRYAANGGVTGVLPSAYPSSMINSFVDFQWIRDSRDGGSETISDVCFPASAVPKWSFIVYDPISKTISLPNVMYQFEYFSTDQLGTGTGSGYAMSALHSGVAKPEAFFQIVRFGGQWALNLHGPFTTLEQSRLYVPTSVSTANPHNGWSSKVGIVFEGNIRNSASHNATAYASSNTKATWTNGNVDLQLHENPQYLSYVGVSCIPELQGSAALSVKSPAHAFWSYDGYSVRDTYWHITNESAAKRRYLLAGDKTMIKISPVSDYVDAWRLDLAGDASISQRYMTTDGSDGTKVTFAKTTDGTNHLLNLSYDDVTDSVIRESFTDLDGTSSPVVLEAAAVTPGSQGYVRFVVTRGMMYRNDGDVANLNILGGGVPLLRLR